MIKVAALFWLFLLLLTGGAMLSGNYQVRVFDAALSHILKATIQEPRDSRLPTPEPIAAAGPAGFFA